MFECDICHIKFNTELDLYQHRESVHKLFSCDYANCDYTSKRRHDVKKHKISQHSGHVKCSHCNR